jgi:glycerol-3-phosphate dehydrogenase (NAD(P)+)
MERLTGSGRLERSRPYVASVPTMEKIAVIGAGSWGTTVATLAAGSAPTVLWARRSEVVEEISTQRTNSRYLPDRRLPDSLSATASLADAASDADLLVIAVPSHGFRSVFADLAPAIPATTPILSLTKGIEQETLATMTRVIAEEAPGHDPSLVGVMTGPNLSVEIAAGHPTAAVVAMRDHEAAQEIQELFMSPGFRVYTNEDVVGCELGGAIKNVMAIAAGMSDGLGFGDNTRATLITRALHELTRLGIALGGQPTTFAGLAGMGDLIATCSSTRSRNHQVGFHLASGKSLANIVDEMKMVAEGIKTTTSVLGLAASVDVEMPIAEHVSMVLHEGVHPREAVLSLMTRQAKAEV